MAPTLPLPTLPLPTLLSQVLVAFTIEFDNEAEHQLPHRTTRTNRSTGSTGATASTSRGPWLVSQPMWANFMRFVTPEGVALRDLEGRGRITNLKGLQRWGYIVVGPDPTDTGTTPWRAASVVRATSWGAMAQQVWAPLAGIIEERWRFRFGPAEIDRLRHSLQALVDRLDIVLPDYLPVVGYAMVSRLPPPAGAPARVDGDAPSLGPDLTALISKLLLAFTLEFEAASTLSLPMSANVLRVLTEEEPLRVRDLPRLTGVSKEAIAMVLGFLEKRTDVELTRDPTDTRTKLVRLTSRGRKERDRYLRLVVEIDERWGASSGDTELSEARRVLALLVGDSTPASPLFAGIEPYRRGGGRPSRSASPFPITPWSSTGADSPTAAENGQDCTVAWDYLRSSYDATAAKYEARFLDELRAKPRDRELLDAFAKSVEDPVAEIGSGPGQIGAFVRQWGRRVVGIDLSPEMAKLARTRLDGAVAADMRALPLGPESLGGLLAFYSLIHLHRAELGGVLGDFRRVLRPGGRVLFSAHEGQDEVELDEFLNERVPFAATFFELDELVGAAEAAGFEVASAERRPPYPNESNTTRLYVEAVKVA